MTATNSLVSLGTIPPVSPGQSVSLALSLATNAPAGGVTVNFTSSNPASSDDYFECLYPAGSAHCGDEPADHRRHDRDDNNHRDCTELCSGYPGGERDGDGDVQANFDLYQFFDFDDHDVEYFRSGTGWRLDVHADVGRSEEGVGGVERNDTSGPDERGRPNHRRY